MTPSFQSSRAKHGLNALFNPDTVAVIGATDRPATVGRTVLQNLLDPAFRGKVYPVNPHRSEVLGTMAYKGLRDIPDLVDLAVLATPATAIPALIGECAARGPNGPQRPRILKIVVDGLEPLTQVQNRVVFARAPCSRSRRFVRRAL
jgi:predicted CoA-binding protein